MRDQRFVLKHRGGTLKNQDHYLLMLWACVCAEHVLPLVGKIIDNRLIEIIEVAKDWIEGNTTVGEARKASVLAHVLARETDNTIYKAVARSIGHAVAVAHMADHALGAALYALKAAKAANKSVADERNWQNQQLPNAIQGLILSTRPLKEKSLNL